MFTAGLDPSTFDGQPIISRQAFSWVQICLDQLYLNHTGKQTTFLFKNLLVAIHPREYRHFYSHILLVQTHNKMKSTQTLRYCLQISVSRLSIGLL